MRAENPLVICKDNTMTAQTLTVLSIPTPPVPRGATMAAAVFSALAGLFKRTPRFEVPRRVAEAAEVRALAHQFESIDPSFAADLYAAALRHEAQDD